MDPVQRTRLNGPMARARNALRVGEISSARVSREPELAGTGTQAGDQVVSRSLISSQAVSLTPFDRSAEIPAVQPAKLYTISILSQAGRPKIA